MPDQYCLCMNVNQILFSCLSVDTRVTSVLAITAVLRQTQRVGVFLTY